MLKLLSIWKINNFLQARATLLQCTTFVCKSKYLRHVPFTDTEDWLSPACKVALWMGTGITFQRGMMDEVPLKLTMLSDSSTQLLYFCHSFSLSIGIYTSSAQHSSAHKGPILCQQTLTNVCMHVFLKKWDSSLVSVQLAVWHYLMFTGSRALHAMDMCHWFLIMVLRILGNKLYML